MNFLKYTQELNESLYATDYNTIENFGNVIEQAAENHNPVYVFGNGGSASTADHFACDHTKGVKHDTNLSPHIVSLSSNMALFSAIANDYGYEFVFSEQIRHFPRISSVAVGISASGNSQNVVKALIQAKEMGFKTVALVGFSGGIILEQQLADIIVHVPSSNYGIVEDSHAIIMHAIAQSIRSKHAKPNHYVYL